MGKKQMDEEWNLYRLKVEVTMGDKLHSMFKVTHYTFKSQSEEELAGWKETTKQSYQERYPQPEFSVCVHEDATPIHNPPNG